VPKRFPLACKRLPPVSPRARAPLALVTSAAAAASAAGGKRTSMLDMMRRLPMVSGSARVMRSLMRGPVGSTGWTHSTAEMPTARTTPNVWSQRRFSTEMITAERLGVSATGAGLLSASSCAAVV